MNLMEERLRVACTNQVKRAIDIFSFSKYKPTSLVTSIFSSLFGEQQAIQKIYFHNSRFCSWIVKKQNGKLVDIYLILDQ